MFKCYFKISIFNNKLLYNKLLSLILIILFDKKNV